MLTNIQGKASQAKAKVIYISRALVLYELDGNETFSAIDWFLVNFYLPEKPKTKWYRVSYWRNICPKPCIDFDLWKDKESFVSAYGLKESDFKWISMELVYEE